MMLIRRRRQARAAAAGPRPEQRSSPRHGGDDRLPGVCSEVVPFTLAPPARSPRYFRAQGQSLTCADLQSSSTGQSRHVRHLVAPLAERNLHADREKPTSPVRDARRSVQARSPSLSLNWKRPPSSFTMANHNPEPKTPHQTQAHAPSTRAPALYRASSARTYNSSWPQARVAKSNVVVHRQEFSDPRGETLLPDCLEKKISCRGDRGAGIRAQLKSSRTAPIITYLPTQPAPVRADQSATTARLS